MDVVFIKSLKINLLFMIALAIYLCFCDSEFFEIKKEESAAANLDSKPSFIKTSHIANHVCRLKPEKCDNIPLSEALQTYTISICNKYEIDSALVFAVMKIESGYHSDAVSKDGNCFGLMQINLINWGWLKNTLPIESLTNPRDNILAGVYMLSRLFSVYDDTEKVLMCYNCGEAAAKKLWKHGIQTTDYVNKVLTAKEELDF